MLRQLVNSTARVAAQRRRLGIQLLQPRCHQSTSIDEDKTTATILNQEADSGLMVDAYSQVGFRLNNGMKVLGPIAIFPRSVLSWKVKSVEDINEDSLSLFHMLVPKIDLLVIGVGDKGNKVDPHIVHYMKNKGITLEILPTETACTTFNFLNQERRYVAGAFLPPISLRVTDEDFVQSQRRRNKLFLSEDEDSVF
ncbi:NADH dehydrogenase [ubiquinone] 1 alpha subcomplex assembly factor 3-like [Penaeus monodon]|uniref:NADH dehydrogenase [ubiquinone] 1 alpha subcomplex assembly factor 3-like n=1 Tax=Penaeus monodon TaxID=6687 RepID=UPI0018A7532D|nr:NADH dehydrogenase [ubiquinone] 1 alpha subcomplex assembly factor 3-like [Penaeus monodon]